MKKHYTIILSLAFVKQTLSIILFTLGLISIQSCKKEEIKNISIEAGQITEDMNSVIPPGALTLGSICKGTNAGDCNWTNPSMPIDLNGDKSFDVVFTSSVASNYSDYYKVKSDTLLTVLCDATVSYSLEPLNEDDKINDTNNWVSLKSDYGQSDEIDNSMLAYYLISDKHILSMSNKWKQYKYFAVRIKKGKRISYGWVKLKIDNFNQLSVDSWAMQK